MYHITEIERKKIKEFFNRVGGDLLRRLWDLGGLLGANSTSWDGVKEHANLFVSKVSKDRDSALPNVIGIGWFRNDSHVTPYLDIFGLGRIHVNGGLGRGDGRVVTYWPDGNIKTRAWDDFHIHHMDEKIYAKAVELRKDQGGNVWQIAYVLKNFPDQSETGGKLLDILKANGAFLNPDGVEQMGKDNQYADAPSENAPKCEGQIHQQLLNIGLTKIGKEHGCLDGQSFGNCGIWGFSKVFVYFILFDELNKNYRTLQEKGLSDSDIFKKATNSDYVDDVWKKAKFKVKEFWGELMVKNLENFFASPALHKGKDPYEVLNDLVSLPTLAYTHTRVRHGLRLPTTLGAMIYHFFGKVENIMNGEKDGPTKITGGLVTFSSGDIVNSAALEFMVKLGLKLDRDTPNRILASAARNNRGVTIKHLLHYGADVNSKTSYYNPKTCHYSEHRTSLHWASDNGSLMFVMDLVGKGANVHEADGDGRTPLMIAAQEGHLNLVEFFVGNGANVHEADKNGDTPLIIAAKNGHLDVVEILLGNGADIDKADKNGDTPLIIAAKNGHLDVVEFILKLDLSQFRDCSMKVSYTNCIEKYVVFIEKLKSVEQCNRIDRLDNNTLRQIQVEYEELLLIKLKHVLQEGIGDFDYPGAFELLRKMYRTGAFTAEGSSRSVMLRGITESIGAANNLTGINKIDFTFTCLKLKGDLSATPLHWASNNGELDFVKHLVCTKGADIDEAGEGGHTPLYLAAENGHLDIVECLLSKGAKPNEAGSCSKRNTPLLAAVKNGHLDVVDYLLRNHAFINKTNNDGCTALLIAAENGHFEIIKRLFKFGRRNAHKANKLGNTPLHMAAMHGYLEIVRLLLGKDACVHKVNRLSNTPLHEAAMHGHLNIVELLLDNSAYNSAYVNLMNYDGKDALLLAASCSHLKIVELLLDKDACVDKADRFGNTPLLAAAENGHLEIVKRLLAKGADIDKANKNSKSPLLVAEKNGRLDVVKYLVDEGADGTTPLHYASKLGDLDVVKHLVDKGSDISKTDNRGCSPAEIALENNHLPIAKYLLGVASDRGDLVFINDFKSRMKLLDHNGINHMHNAAYLGYLNVVEFLLGGDYGCNVYTPTKCGKTPLYCASFNGHLGVVQYLVDKGAEVNTGEGYCGSTALGQACKRGHIGVVKFLLESGADINKADKDGNTPLHLAVKNGCLGYVKDLVKSGADINKADKDGNTPLHLAVKNGCLGYVKDLVKSGADINKANNGGQTPVMLASNLDNWNHKRGVHGQIVSFLKKIAANESNEISKVNIELEAVNRKLIKAAKLAVAVAGNAAVMARYYAKVEAKAAAAVSFKAVQEAASQAAASQAAVAKAAAAQAAAAAQIAVPAAQIAVAASQAAVAKAAAAQAAAAAKIAVPAAQIAVEAAQAAVSQAAAAQAIVENNARFRFRVAITFAIVAVAVVSVPLGLGLGVGLVAAIPFVVAGCLLGRVGQNTKKTQNKHNRGATALLDNKLGKKIESDLNDDNISP